jgi:hypothetical protein
MHSSLPTLPFAPSALLFPPSKPSLLLILHPTNILQFYHIENRRLLPLTSQLYTLNNTLRAQPGPVESAVFEPSRTGSRSAKIVIWSNDWMCTAKLDLEQIGKGGKGALSGAVAVGGMAHGAHGQGTAGTPRSTRKKRAREAREQLEAISVGSPASAAISLPESGSGGASASAGVSARISASPIGNAYISSNDPDFFKMSNTFKSVACVEWIKEGELCVVERPVLDFVGELPPAFWSGGFGRS